MVTDNRRLANHSVNQALVQPALNGFGYTTGALLAAFYEWQNHVWQDGKYARDAFFIYNYNNLDASFTML